MTRVSIVTNKPYADSLRPCHIRGQMELQHAYWRNREPVSQWQHVLIGIYVLMLGLVASTGNVLVIWACVRYRSLRTTSNLLVVNLALGDLLMCFIDFPLFMAASFMQHWPYGKAVCEAYGSLTATAGLVTINSLAVISLDRYRAVSRRINPTQRRSMRTTVVATSCVWFYSVPWALAPALGWGDYVLDGIGTTCTFDFFTRSFNNVSFVLSVAVGNFVIPLSVIVCSYSGIWMVVRGTHVSLRQQGDVTVSLGTRRQRLGIKSDLKTAAIILGIVAAFVVSWTPYLIVSFLGLFGEGRGGITSGVSVLVSLVAKTSTALNPVIYSISHPKMRRKLRLMLRTFCSSQPLVRQHTGSRSGSINSNSGSKNSSQVYRTSFSGMPKSLQLVGLVRGKRLINSMA